MKISKTVSKKTLAKSSNRTSTNQQENDPANQKGHAGTSPFQFDTIDSVNIFNGNLNLTIPIGIKYPLGGVLGSYSLSLHYNSKVWDLISKPIGLQCKPAHYNSGLGWRLSLGRLLDPQHEENRTGKWILESGDGARHKFFETLHLDEPKQYNVFYTRDNSYLRLKISSNGAVVDAPNGTSRKFDKEGRLLELTDNLKKPNFLKIQYFSHQWKLKDSQGRIHFVDFKENNTHSKYPQIDTIRVAGFNDKKIGEPKAVYSFGYKKIKIERQLRALGSPRLHPVTLLEKITRPDGSAFNMEYYQDNDRYNNPDTTDSKKELRGVSGAIKNLQLPTKGNYEWHYAPYEFRVSNHDNPNEIDEGWGWEPKLKQPTFISDEGVYNKRILSKKNKLVGTWKYRPEKPSLQVNTQRRTIVTSPEGHETIHYFYIDNGNNWKHGLPFTMKKKKNGLYLSKETFKGSSSKRSNLLRSEYIKYATDKGGISGTGNIRIQAQRTYFHDDRTSSGAIRFSEIIQSEYDGLGNFRKTQTNGNFIGNNIKIDETNFNKNVGTYDFDPYKGSVIKNTFNINRIPQPNHKWLLTTFDYKVIKSEGETIRSDFYFNSHGQVFASRQRLLAHKLSKNDILSFNKFDDYGNLIEEKFYGGDTQSISTASNYLVKLPTKAVFQTDHEYSYGVLARSQPINTFNGKNASYFSHKIQVNKYTGLTNKSWDPAGVPTTYKYDQMGRVTRVQPSQMASTTYQYHFPNRNTGRAKITEIQQQGSTVFKYKETFFNSFGKPNLEQMIIGENPNGSNQWSRKRMYYNASGMQIGFSENTSASKPLHFTWLRGIDPFGRPTKIIPPDGEKHAIIVKYHGVSKIVRQARWKASNGSSKYVPRVEVMDRFERLIQMHEHSNPTDSGNMTEYQYNVYDKIVLVKTATKIGGKTKTQLRKFTYDGRGFMTKEQHPELGKNGNGFITYTKYDVSGKVIKKKRGGLNFFNEYDAFGRIVKISSNGKTMKTLVYGKSNSGSNKRNGKLIEATRHNHVPIPWVQSDPIAEVKVKEIYEYKGLSGKISKRETHINIDDVKFRQGFSYTPDGQISKLIYPRKINNATNQEMGEARIIKYNYAFGLLKKVEELNGANRVTRTFANDISYHANSLVHQVKHGNNWIYQMDNDPNEMTRPHAISVINPKKEVTKMGPFQYDSHGNILEIMTSNGPDRFEYDKVNRLKKVTYNSGLSQSYTYDTFGNLTQLKKQQGDKTIEDNIFSINPITNHLTGGFDYDASGNIIKVKSGFHYQHNSKNKPVKKSGTIYEYDAFNMLTRVKEEEMDVVHIYTPDNERIWSVPWNELKGTFDTQVFDWYFRDLKGRMIRQMQSNEGNKEFTLVRDHIFRSNILLSSVDNTDGVLHYHPDHLGSPLLITRENGTVKSFHFYIGFGDESTDPKQDDVKLKFTGHERDAISENRMTDLDYMHARFYSAHLGRFMSIDPANSWKPNQPQSWNRYVYGLNNPMKYIDPDGREVSIFIVEGSRNNFPDSFMGHAAIHVSINGDSRGVSTGTPIDFKDGVDNFIKSYHDQGRDVTEYKLDDLTEKQESQMLEYIDSTGGKAGTDKKEGGFLEFNMLRNNCAKAVSNVLKAGNASPADNASGILMFDAPLMLESNITSGRFGGVTKIQHKANGTTMTGSFSAQMLEHLFKARVGAVQPVY